MRSDVKDRSNISDLLSEKFKNQKDNMKGIVLWLTGLSGAGKSTVAFATAEHLKTLGIQAYVLDGDILRTGLCSDLSFSSDDRRENCRRVAEVSKILTEAGVVVLVSLISPFTSDRENAKSLFNKDEFVEVYCACPLEVCETRDIKGLYRKARSGELAAFTGISSPYEEPTNPDLVIHSEYESLDESVQKILKFLMNRNFVNGSSNLSEAA
jgi:adenylylsulfate kinase